MKRTIKVMLGEGATPIGTLRFDAHGQRQSSSFEYDGAWLGDANHFTIDPLLQLVSGPQFRKKPRHGSSFAAALADTEPDGWGRRVIMRDHARRRKAGEPVPDVLTDLDFLLSVDDASRVGALRFQDERGTFQRAIEPWRRRSPSLVELSRLLSATRAVESETESQTDLEYLRGRGTSLGGMRPKCTVTDDAGTLSIGKFPSVADTRPMCHGEVLAMKLAARSGIRVAQAQLVQSDGIPVALIRRFDRHGGARRMYVSAATLLGADTDGAEEHSYTEIVDAIRVHGADAQNDIDELWRRIAFSILITNVDDHLHNHGFLHSERGLWRLSPAFDLNPMPDRARELKTWISDAAGPEATIDGLMSVAPYFKISTARAREILAHVEGAVATWRDEGRNLGMSEGDLDKFAHAFEHAERDEAKKAAALK